MKRLGVVYLLLVVVSILISFGVARRTCWFDFARRLCTLVTLTLLNYRHSNHGISRGVANHSDIDMLESSGLTTTTVDGVVGVMW